jgi:hypothetical protein
MSKIQHFDQDGTLIRTEDIPDPPEQVAEQSVTNEAATSLNSLRTIVNGTGSMTSAQLTMAVRSIARVLIVLVRLSLKRFDGTD